MTLLIKMLRTLVTFSITLMLKVRVFSYSSRGWVNPPRQEYEKKQKIQHAGF